MSVENAVRFVEQFDMSGLVQAEVAAGAKRNHVEASYEEARNLVVLAIKNNGAGIVPTERGDRHALFDSASFLAGLKACGWRLEHHPGAVGDFQATAALYRKEFGSALSNPAGCLITAAGCLITVGTA